MAEDYEADDDFEEEEFEEPEAEPIDEIHAAGATIFGTMERTGADRISTPYLGWLARSALISRRVKQLEGGEPSVIPTNELKSGVIGRIAEQELEERKIPLKIVRKFPGGIFETWNIGDFVGIAGVKRLFPAK